jgi:integrase
MELPKGVRERGKRSFQIRYTNAQGEKQQETITGETREAALTEAIRQLTIRHGAIASNLGPVTSKPHTITFGELCDDVVLYYEMKKLRSTDDIRRRYLLHLLPFFGTTRKAADFVAGDFTRYVVHRQKQGAADGNINLELQAAKRAFRLAKQNERIFHTPYIEMLNPNNVREGFFERDQLEAICRHLPAHLVPVARFGYITGWRHQEVMTREWRHVHADGVRMEKSETKNGKGRTFPMVGELRELLEGIRPKVKYFPNQRIFRTPGGDEIKTFYKSWATACRKAGLAVKTVPVQRALRNDDGTIKRDGKNQPVLAPVIIQRGKKKGQVMTTTRAAVFFHDFRRTAYRNLVRMGVPEVIAQGAVGWLDADTARRYDIPAKADSESLRAIYDITNPVSVAKNTDLVANFSDRKS